MRLMQKVWYQLSGQRKRDQTERDSDWYDAVYSKPDTDYYKHYTESMYYFIWAVIVDRIPTTASVLEIGCGPGRLATFLNERGIGKYIGFDFSPQAIALARENAPSLEFHVANALTTELLECPDYDVLICTEVLEHIEADLDVLRRVRPGVRCLITVPNFPYPSHVRHFKDKAMVSARYGSLFTQVRVDAFRKDSVGGYYFLLDGVKNEVVE